MKCNCYYDINGSYYCSKLLSKNKEYFTQTEMPSSSDMQQETSDMSSNMQQDVSLMPSTNIENVNIAGNSEPIIEYPAPIKVSENNTSNLPSSEILRQQLLSLVQSGQLTQNDIIQVLSLTAK
jgi:hypothetical protein